MVSHFNLNLLCNALLSPGEHWRMIICSGKMIRVCPRPLDSITGWVCSHWCIYLSHSTAYFFQMLCVCLIFRAMPVFQIHWYCVQIIYWCWKNKYCRHHRPAFHQVVVSQKLKNSVKVCDLLIINTLLVTIGWKQRSDLLLHWN